MKKKEKNEGSKLPSTKQNKNIAGEKRFWKKFGIDDPGKVPQHFRHVNLSHSSVSDADLSYLAGRVSSIDMLDLNETEISNDGIHYLAGLQQLLELRLKECALIDNGCIDFLNKLTGLRLLHVKDTGITIDGLLKLDRLVNLEELYFSADSISEIDQELQQLSLLHPGCRLVVNGTVYS